VLAKRSFLSRLVNRFWVKSAVVPQNPLAELKLDLSRPIIYVLDQNSASDLLALQQACRELALPDPYQALSLNSTGGQQLLPAVIYLHQWHVFKKAFFANKTKTKKTPRYLTQYQDLLTLHQLDPAMDVQLVPVTFFWGRNPGRQKSRKIFSGQSNPNIVQKAWSILTAGRDQLIRFNAPISVRNLVDQQKNSKQQAYKLARLAVYFFRAQHRSSRGPQIPKRHAMIKRMIASDMMQQVIKEQSLASGQSEQEISRQCKVYLEEITSNFSYRFLRIFRAVLSKVWNGIYQGIEVNHAQKVRDATQSGAEIIYMPCHRSHMDYLLLSYLLFEEGMMPPHIAAGVNLNFFPAGGIFRRSGAFFLRRSFKDNPVYGKVFKAYFALLFKQGYPIEFFTEGGRSRTGRLLPAKTGLLAMSVETFLAQPERNVMIVPVSIGYDHIMEVSTYMKELSGQKKEKETAWQVLGIIKKLRNFGQAFVNFGEPINLKQYFDQHQPDWRDNALTEQQFYQQVNVLADNVMQGINHATAVNALPLCGAILLATKAHQIGKQRLLTLITLHQQLLAEIVKTSNVTYPTQSEQAIYDQALAMNKFSETNFVVSCDHKQSTHLTYYRNTIVHVFALHALLSHRILQLHQQQEAITLTQVMVAIQRLFPFVEAEYFLTPANEDLDARALAILWQFKQAGLIQFDGQKIRAIETESLHILSEHLQETRLRYYSVLTLLANDSYQSDTELLAATQQALLGNSIEPFDEKVIKVFIKNLDRTHLSHSQVNELLMLLSK